jgi:hypothetical protein
MNSTTLKEFVEKCENGPFTCVNVGVDGDGFVTVEVFDFDGDGLKVRRGRFR